MMEIVNSAKAQILRTVRTKRDAFLLLCSLNLLNAVVKKSEYKGVVGYGMIKPNVVKFILQCIDGDDIKYVDEVYYDAKGQCIYIRCYGIQFSFHNVGANSLGNFVNSANNKRVEWDGVRLQPIAFELFELGQQYMNGNDIDIQDEFMVILNNANL